MSRGTELQGRAGPWYAALAIGVACLVLAGCGGDGNGDSETLTGGDVGSPAPASEADRVVEIRALPTNRFDPSTVDVKVGETITFRVINEDDTFHEFMIADKKAHEERDEEMAGMGSDPMSMPDESNDITLAAGQTEDLTWTFPTAGKVLFADHQPGNYKAGMVGTINVT